MSPSNIVEAWTIQSWLSFLQDEAALLRHPGACHKVLVDEAHALHRANLIDRDGLNDLLEQANGALAYAVEALLMNQARNRRTSYAYADHTYAM
jgi:hypothetical protein